MPSLRRRTSRPSPADVAGDEDLLDTPLDDTDLQARLDAASERRTPRSTKILVAALLVLVGFAFGAMAGRASAEFQAMMAEQVAAQTGAPAATGGEEDAAEAVDLSKPVEGTVKAVDGRSVFVELADGTTLRVVVGDDTAVLTVVDADFSDVRSGQRVTVEGFADERGVVTAERFTAR